MSGLAVDTYDCDVLVVGGGLVGLAASMFLAQQGLRVWLVERHAATSSHPKLRGVGARTMELYRSVGIEEAIRAAGETISVLRSVPASPVNTSGYTYRSHWPATTG